MQPMIPLYEILKQQRKLAEDLILFWNELSQLNFRGHTIEDYQNLLTKWHGLTESFMDSSTSVSLLLEGYLAANPIYKISQGK